MPEFIMPLECIDEVHTFNALDGFTRGYIEGIFFTDTGSGDDGELEKVSFGDLHPEAIKEIVDICKRYQERYVGLLERAYACPDYSPVQAGRDLWFTSNGHGVGFWGRQQLGDLGYDLTTTCGWRTDFPEHNIYLGDDKKIHFTRG